MNTEYLSDDILEEEFIKCFTPYCYLQMILGSCRIDARDRFVTAPSLFQKAYTVICIIMCTFAFIYLNYILYSYKFKDDFNLFLMCFSALALTFVTYLCIVIDVRFLNCDDNVKFIVQLQKIDRMMGIKNNRTFQTLNRLLNYGSMSFLAILYIIPCVGMWYQDSVIGIGMLGVLYSQTTSAVEIIFCSNIIMFFFTRVRFLNSIMRNHLQHDIHDVKTSHILYPSVKQICSSAAMSHDFISSDTDVYLKEILHAFKKLQHLYKYQILIFYFKFISVAFVTFNIALFILQNREIEIFFFSHVPMISVIDLLLSTFMCISCHIFINEIECTKRLSTNVMAMHCTGPLREKAKRMWILIDKTPPKFSVYDMWHINLFLLLKTFNILTTFVITRLQFALL